MKQKQKNLMILLTTVILLLVALIAVTTLTARGESASRAAEQQELGVLAFNAQNAEKLSYTYNGESLTFQKTGDAWQLADDPDYSLDTTKVDSMIVALCSLDAERNLGAQQDLSTFGFEKPQLQVTVTVDGEDDTLIFGDTNAVTNQVYLMRTGNADLYLVGSNKLSVFQFAKADLYKEPADSAAADETDSADSAAVDRETALSQAAEAIESTPAGAAQSEADSAAAESEPQSEPEA